MSALDTIDALAVANRLLSSPKRYRLSSNEELAMAGCVVGLAEQLDRTEEQPPTNARLAAAIAGFIQKEEALNAAKDPDGYVPLQVVAARYDAFNALKTIFETEFPNV